MAKNSLSLVFDNSKILNVSITKGASGYNYASVSAKLDEDEYVNISYEWRGQMVPDYVMDLMLYLQSYNKEQAALDEETKKEVAAFISRVKEECL